MPEITFYDILKILSGGFLGGLIGSYLNHKFTAPRDRENRKREFKGFLEERRAIIEPIPTTDIVRHYFEHARNFRREAERVRGDFNDKAAFSGHVKALGHMTPEVIRGWHKG